MQVGITNPSRELLGLLAGHAGFDLHWQIHDRGDDLPEHWDIRESYEQRGFN